MRRLRAFFVRLLGLAGSTHGDADFTAELESHIALDVEVGIRAGLTAQEARRQAIMRLGGIEQARQAQRERRTLPTLESLMQDVRFALRQLRRSPGFTATAVLTLALGIGANTAVFSLFDTVLLHPVPYRDPSRLMLVTESEPNLGPDEFGVAMPEAQDYIHRSRSFAQMGTYESAGYNLTGQGRPLRVNAALVSSSVFPLLGVAPALGRAFTQDEDRYGNHHVVVLSWQLWRNQFAADAHITGKSIRLDETEYTIVGVMPASFRFPFDGKPISEMADLWVPDAIAPERLDPERRLMEFGVGLIGRLKPEVSPAQAAAEMQAIANGFEAEHADVYSGTLHVAPHTYLFAGHAMQKARPLVVLLMAAVACVLLIACANVGNLLLARASRRTREMAIRGAVGANRIRLMRQCLVESLVLALGGAALGVGIAFVLLQAIRLYGPQSVPRLHEAAIHPAVLAFTLLITLATAIVFGIMPAWKLAHTAPIGSLRGNSHAVADRSTHRLQNTIATAEVALALVLLVAGGMLLHSMVLLVSTPSGFDPEGALVVRTMFDAARYPDAAKRELVQREILDRLAQLPGVTSVAAASHLPLSDERQIGIRLEHAAANDFHFTDNSLITPGYFRTMGVPIVRGRDFSMSDTHTSMLAAIVSEAFARTYLHGAEPIGQRFWWGDRGLFTVVGVAHDIHIGALDADPPPMVYQSMYQVQSGASGRMALILRSGRNQSPTVQSVQQIVASLDASLPIYNSTSLDALVEASLAQRRFTLILLGAFAAISAALAVIGLFGVLSYIVEQRRAEMGVRMALGATRSRILRIVLRHGAILGAVGCTIGLVLSALSTPLLHSSLYQVGRFDPITLIVVPCLLMATVVAAALLPAISAASTNPIDALRSE